MKPIQYGAGSRYSHPDPNAARHALKRPCTAANRDLAMLRVLTALHEMHQGRGGWSELLDVSVVVRMAGALVHLGKASAAEVLPLIKVALPGLNQAEADIDAGRCAALTGDDYVAVCSLMSRHQDALERYSGQTFQDAQAVVRDSLAREVAATQQGHEGCTL